MFVLVESRTHDRVHHPGLVRPHRRPAGGRRRPQPGCASRRPVPDASRRHGLRQDLHHGQRHPEGAEAHAGHRPQQDAGRAALQRVPRVPAGQRGGVLRQLLRLLPARGLRRGAGPVHREGLVHQRRDRPPAPRRHHLAVPPPGRRHRRQRELHLRSGLARGLPREDGPPAGRPDRRARRRAPAARRHPVRAQRPRARARQVPRPRRLGGDLARGPGHRHPRAVVGRRGRADRQLRPGRRRGHRATRPRRHLPGHALRHQRPGRRARARRDPPRDGGALRLVRGERQGPRGSPPAPAHPVRHGDAARDGLLQRHRELLPHPPGQGAGRHAQLPARLLPRRLPLLRRRVAHVPAADPRHVRGRQVAQAAAGGLRLPSAERPRQPPAALRRVPRQGAAAHLRERHARRVRAGQQPQHRRADHPPHGPHRPCRRDPSHRGPDRRPHERDPPSGRQGTSASWSRR